MSRLDDILALPKITHDLVQGTPEWLAFRMEHDGASEAAAMLGLSKKVTRTALLDAKKTGLAREFGEFLQRILDNGHVVEAAARPHIEAKLGTDLYPATCSRGRMSASCDGIDLGDTIVFEHKQWNEALAASVRAGVVPDEHQPQCQQILLVTGAERVLFVVSDGTPEKMVSAEVLPDRKWWERIVDGWAQFDIDLADHVPPAASDVDKIVAEPVEALPAPVVQVSGQLTLQDNFKVFETRLRDFLEHRLIRQPKSDEDFVNLDAQIKAMKQAREALKAAEAQMLAQVQPVDQAKKTKDMLDTLLQQNLSMAERLLKDEKERRRGEIVAVGVKALSDHVAALNQRLGKPYMPTVSADFGGCVRGLKSLASMEDKVSTELARAKIDANRIADGIQCNLNWLREHAKDHTFLFADTAQLVLRDADYVQLEAKRRIDEHLAAKAREEEATRERIRAEEAARLQREAEDKANKERQAQEEAAQRKRDEEYLAGAEERERHRQAEMAVAVLKVRAQSPAGSEPNAAPSPAANDAPTSPAPAAKVVPIARPAAAKPTRPTDDEIIEVLALHYRVHESKVIEWLHDMDLAAAGERMAAHI